MTKRKTQEKIRERGITLIALVITIIVLLILAGVAISALTGDSGILSNSEKAKENTALANADSTKEYTSSLLFGLQFDLVCKFLDEKTGIDIDSAWGNFTDTLYTPSSTAKYSSDHGKSYTPVKGEVSYSKTTEEEILLTTGAIEETTEGIDTNPMNIYDFAGNVIEYILYHSKSENYPCYIPGASYDTYFEWGGVCNNSSVSTVVADSTYGFRSTLY